MFREHLFRSFLGEGSLICLLQEAGIVDISLSFDNDCDRQMMLLLREVNPISKWFVMIVCSCLVTKYSMSLEGVPCNSDLYLYLNIEMAIGLVQ